MRYVVIVQALIGLSYATELKHFNFWTALSYTAWGAFVGFIFYVIFCE